MKPYLKIDHIEKTFKRGNTETKVLADINLSIEKGEYVSIIGHSGCGKSTLLNIIAGLLPATSGGVLLEDREVNEPGPDRAVVFQNHSLLPWLTVYDNVRLGVDKVFSRTKTRAERDAWTLHNLDLVQMTHAKDKRPAEISGGMKQRVGIARALAMEPKVLLLDEPFGALDALTRAHLQDSVMALHQKLGNTVLMITHDVDEAVLLSDRIVMMTNGPSARIGEVLDVPLQRPRKRLEMAANPDLPEVPAARARIPLRAPSLRGGRLRHVFGSPGKKMSEPLVVIGNGMAAARFVDELTTRALGRYSVAVIGNEGKLAYNRVLLSSVLANETELSDIELKSFDWWKDRGVTLLYDHAAVSVDPAIRRVRLANGATLPYKHLVFATGSRPIRPGTPGMDLPGVLTFRDLGDVAAIRKAAGPHTRAVVIGGGLLGLEAAYGLAKARAKVTLLHLMDRLMERQLDPHAAAMLKNAVESRGVEVLLKAETARIEDARGGESGDLERWPPDRSRSRGRRGRHPSQYRSRAQSRRRHQSRHCRQRQTRNIHSRPLRDRRMRGASRPMLWPG